MMSLNYMMNFIQLDIQDYVQYIIKMKFCYSYLHQQDQ